MSPHLGEIWYNDTLGWHVLIMEYDDLPHLRQQGWRRVLILETGEYNWCVDNDFTNNQYGWVRAA